MEDHPDVYDSVVKDSMVVHSVVDHSVEDDLVVDDAVVPGEGVSSVVNSIPVTEKYKCNATSVSMQHN